MEILSRHATDEVYLGKRDQDEWTADSKAIREFQKFGQKLEEIEKGIEGRNDDPHLQNRIGPVKMPYLLLAPSSKEGLTCRGIPNSISI